MQIESAPKLLQTFVFLTRAGVPRINQGNGGLSESAWISRAVGIRRRLANMTTDFPITQWTSFVKPIEWTKLSTEFKVDFGTNKHLTTKVFTEENWSSFYINKMTLDSDVSYNTPTFL